MNNNHITDIKNYINYITSKDTFENQDDIRSITLHAFYQVTQSFLYSYILSTNIEDINYCKNNFSTDVDSEDLPTLLHNYHSFIVNAFFINSFVHVENHIRQIGLYYENKIEDINETSITKTFRNLMNKNKTIHFQKISEDDFKLFEFYCFIRNTMHNVGFHTQHDKKIIIEDKNSILNRNRIEIELIENSSNSISFDTIFFIQEQITKLVLKINSLIPKSDIIKHRFSDIGFND